MRCICLGCTVITAEYRRGLIGSYDHIYWWQLPVFFCSFTLIVSRLNLQSARWRAESCFFTTEIFLFFFFCKTRKWTKKNKRHCHQCLHIPNACAMFKTNAFLLPCSFAAQINRFHPVCHAAIWGSSEGVLRWSLLSESFQKFLLPQVSHIFKIT